MRRSILPLPGSVRTRRLLLRARKVVHIVERVVSPFHLLTLLSIALTIAWLSPVTDAMHVCAAVVTATSLMIALLNAAIKRIVPSDPVGHNDRRILHMERASPSDLDAILAISDHWFGSHHKFGKSAVSGGASHRAYLWMLLSHSPANFWVLVERGISGAPESHSACVVGFTAILPLTDEAARRLLGAELPLFRIDESHLVPPNECAQRHLLLLSIAAHPARLSVVVRCLLKNMLGVHLADVRSLNRDDGKSLGDFHILSEEIVPGTDSIPKAMGMIAHETRSVAGNRLWHGSRKDMAATDYGRILLAHVDTLENALLKSLQSKQLPSFFC